MERESAKSEELSLEGEFTCSVEDAVVMEVTDIKEKSENAPELFARGNRVFEITNDSPKLYGTESVLVDITDVESFIDILYMCQRSTGENSWQLLPKTIEDTYESLIFLQAILYAENGRDAYEDEVERLASIDRFKQEPQGWVKEAILR